VLLAAALVCFLWSRMFLERAGLTALFIGACRYQIQSAVKGTPRELLARGPRRRRTPKVFCQTLLACLGLSRSRMFVVRSVTLAGAWRRFDVVISASIWGASIRNGSCS